jgi:hypothetical protein
LLGTSPYNIYEIQYLPKWEIHLKSLVDSYSTYQFIASGSAAAALKLKSKESGAYQCIVAFPKKYIKHYMG